MWADIIFIVFMAGLGEVPQLKVDQAFEEREATTAECTHLTVSLPHDPRPSMLKKKLTPGETDTLLIGFISLSGVLLLLLILQTFGVVCFVCKTRAQTAAFKKDINPVYGADNEAEAAEENDKRVSNAETYDYMGE